MLQIAVNSGTCSVLTQFSPDGRQLIWGDAEGSVSFAIWMRYSVAWQNRSRLVSRCATRIASTVLIVPTRIEVEESGYST